MPKPPVTKPRTFPKLARGDGSWVWDADRRKVVLKFMVGSKRVMVRGDSPTECLTLRDQRRAAAAEQAADRALVMSKLTNGAATVAEMLDAWFSFHVGPHHQPQTVEGYLRMIRLVKNAPLGSAIASEVTRGDVEDFWVYLVNELDHGRGGLRKVRSHLGMAYDYGERHSYAENNPARRSLFPGNVRPPKKATWLDEDGFRAMRRHLTQNPTTANVALLTGLLTGLRPGEVLALCWNAIDQQESILHVKRNLQVSQGGRVSTVVPRLKNETSERIVEIPAELLPLLLHERSETRLRQMAAKRWRESDLVFVTDDGRPLNHSSLQWHCTKACKAIGVEPVCPNKLRHSNASELLDRGMRIADVAKHLGHKDMVMVTTTYGHSQKKRIPTAALLAEG